MNSQTQILKSKFPNIQHAVKESLANELSNETVLNTYRLFSDTIPNLSPVYWHDGTIIILKSTYPSICNWCHRDHLDEYSYIKIYEDRMIFYCKEANPNDIGVETAHQPISLDLLDNNVQIDFRVPQIDGDKMFEWIEKGTNAYIADMLLSLYGKNIIVLDESGPIIMLNQESGMWVEYSKGSFSSKILHMQKDVVEQLLKSKNEEKVRYSYPATYDIVKLNECEKQLKILTKFQSKCNVGFCDVVTKEICRSKTASYIPTEMAVEKVESNSNIHPPAPLTELDAFEWFTKEIIDPKPHNIKTLFQDIYSRYEQFCSSKMLPTMSKSSLGKELSTKYHPSIRINHLAGYRLKLLPATN